MSAGKVGPKGAGEGMSKAGQDGRYGCMRLAAARLCAKLVGYACGDGCSDECVVRGERVEGGG